MRDVAVVIPAGGVGRRLGRRIPKQFVRLGAAPILALTVEHFTGHPRVCRVIVAVPAAYIARTRRALRKARGRNRLQVVAGGQERQESVWLAMQAVPDGAALTVVHDAVRPFITRALIDRVIATARAGGAAICALPIAETVKRVHEHVVEATVDRSGLWAVQTPQAFRAEILRAAHEKARRDGFLGTDDSMLVERLGHPVTVVPGVAENVKITTPEDLARARRATRAGAATRAKRGSGAGRASRAERASTAGGTIRAERGSAAGRGSRAERGSAAGRASRAKRGNGAGVAKPGSPRLQ